MPDFTETLSGPDIQKAERLTVAGKCLTDMVALKPDEEVIIICDRRSNPETIELLEKAAKNITGKPADKVTVDAAKTSESLLDQVKGHQVILNLNLIGAASTDLYDTDYLAEIGARSLVLLDAPPFIFDKGGMVDENPELVQNRISRMETILQGASGMEVTTSYGTDLKIRIKTGQRKWVGVMGQVREAGKWDNPGAEVFTTPDEFEVDGILMLALVDSEISNKQGVDEFVRLEIQSGMITKISGGESATKFRERLERAAKKELKAGRDPRNVYRFAEMAFGASSGVPIINDENKSWKFKAVPTAVTEKSLGSIHLALGNSDHGEEGAEGVFLDPETHFDLVIAGSGGLRVKMYDNEKDFLMKNNGKDLIRDGRPTSLLLGM